MRLLTWEWKRTPVDDVLLCWKFISFVGLREKKFVSFYSAIGTRTGLNWLL